MRYSRSNKRNGNIVLFLVFCMMAIFGIVALAVDGGLLLDKSRHVQSSADAAAMAAATRLFRNYIVYNGKDLNGSAKADAESIAAKNGYDSSNSTVTVNIPPTSGDHVGEDGYAEVIIAYKQQSFFSNVLGHKQTMIRGRAVARGRWVKENNGIIVLDPSVKGALNAHGGGAVNVIGADVIVNSSHAEAAIGSGGAMLVSENFAIFGGVNDYSHFDGNVITGVPPTPDPLRSLPPPNPESLPIRSTKKFHKSGGDHSLLPGVYQGGISITGSASLFLAPGIYYMDGGGFDFSGQGGLTGYEVMIYNAPHDSNDRLNITGLGAVTLTAPETGVYKGVTFFQDRSADVSGSVEGNGLFNIRGTFYAAGALLSVDGNGDVSIGAQYISRMLDIGGNGDVNITWDSSVTAPLRQIHLVE